MLEKGIINEINLAKECFCNLTALKQIEINAKKITVGDNCFKGAIKLQNVLINGGSVTISDHCFNDCILLKSLTIKYLSSISIGSQQFKQCDKLKTISITFPKNESFRALKKFKLDDKCFIGADNIDKFEICGEKMTISNDILNCSSISTLEITSTNDVEFSPETFNDSQNLKDVTIYSRSLTINENCFNRNQSLKNVILNCPYIIFQDNCFNNIDNCNNIQFNYVNNMAFYSNDFCHWKNLIDIDISSINTLDIGPKCFIDN